jgi:hypothetical protein
VNNRFAGTPQDCAGCHLPDFQKTTNPNHVAAGLPTTCAVCHTTTQWAGAKFDHAKTRFTLTGAHVSVACAQCHVGGKYTGTAQECVGCHLPDFQKTTNPNHVAAGFPTTCTTCHTTTQWAGAKFDHSKTRFALTGAHVSVACTQCHVGGKYAGTTMQCYGCHVADYNATSNPNHKAAAFPTDCSVCHTTTNWQGAKFNHNTATRFALTGAHINVACSQCHVNNVFKGLASDCASCHLADYNKATNPNHKSAGFPMTCGTCHTTTSWSGASFNHATTGFALTGAHAAVQCAQCHVNNNYNLTSGACANCHLAKYNATTNPNHKAAGFPQDCSLCHTTTRWTGAIFNHATTGFALTGAHTTVQCAQCHVNNNYNLTSAACVNCHLAKYNATTNPNHVAAGFPMACETCHSTTTWTGATFDHSKTGFALTGVHTTTPCASCHVGGNYNLTSAACYGCHKKEYDTTTNPNHLAAGFPTTCETCHTTTQWTGATFAHTQFPIYSGAHQKSVWNTCNVCHTNPSNYAVFSCIGCHEHDKTRMDPKHSGVKGYVYNSLNCYSCHPQGRH